MYSILSLLKPRPTLSVLIAGFLKKIIETYNTLHRKAWTTFPHNACRRRSWFPDARASGSHICSVIVI